MQPANRIPPTTSERLSEMGNSSARFIIYAAIAAITLYGAAKLLNLPINFNAQVGGFITGGAVAFLLFGAYFVIQHRKHLSEVFKDKIHLTLFVITILAAIVVTTVDLKGVISVKNIFTQQWQGIIAATAITLFIGRLVQCANYRTKMHAAINEIRANPAMGFLKPANPTTWTESAKKTGLFLFYAGLFTAALLLGAKLFGTTVDLRTHGISLITGSLITLTAAGFLYLGWNWRNTKGDKKFYFMTALAVAAVVTMVVLSYCKILPPLETSGVVGGAMTILALRRAYFKRQEKQLRATYDTVAKLNSPTKDARVPTSQPQDGSLPTAEEAGIPVSSGDVGDDDTMYSDRTAGVPVDGVPEIVVPGAEPDEQPLPARHPPPVQNAPIEVTNVTVLSVVDPLNPFF